MKIIRSPFLVLLCVFPICLLGTAHAQDEVEKLFRDALYQEEVKGDPETALKAYREVTAHLDQHRDLAATALFRQAECLRKLERLEEAAANYERVLTQYSDRERVARLSRENLHALGKVPPPETPLIAAEADIPAEEQSEIERLKEILRNSPDLLNNSLDGAPPLHTAAEKGQLAVADFLIEEGARLDVVHQGKTPLHAAAQAGRKAMCELLINNGAEVNSDTGATPLLLALKERREAVAMLLLDEGAEPELGSVSGWIWQNHHWNGNNVSPLQLAIGNELSVGLVVRLIQAGDDVNQLLSDRWIPGASGEFTSMTPLSFAIERGDSEVVNLLLAAGANVAKFDDSLVPPLILALENADSKEPENPIVAALVEAGAEWKSTKENGESTLHVAARQGFADWLKVGVAAGVDPNHLDDSQQTPLHKAAATGHSDCLQILLEAGAYPDTADTLGETALHHVARNRDVEGLRQMIKAGAALNVRNRKGDTAVSIAARKPELSSQEGVALESLEVLLTAEPDTSTPEGNTVYSDAIWGERDGKWTESKFWKDAIQLLVAYEVEATETDLIFLQDDTPSHLRGTSGSPQWSTVVGRNRGQGRPQADNDALRSYLARNSQARDLLYSVWMTMIHQQHADRLAHVVWISQGESAMIHQVPILFEAILSDEVLPTPGRLTQLLRLEYSTRSSSSRRNYSVLHNTDLRKIVVRRGDEEIPVDYKQLLNAETEFQLQWGDVVELPATSEANWESSEDLKILFQGVIPIDVCVQLGENQFLSNVESHMGSIFRIESDQVSVPSDLYRKIGVESPWLSSWSVSRVMANGTLGRTTMEALRHGDLITVVFSHSEPKEQISKEDIKKGVYVCQNPEGPFWRVFPDHYNVPHLDGSPVLELILITPNGLPLYPIDWEQITVRQWTGDAWEESILKDRNDLIEPTPGTLLILPEGSKDSLTLPEWLQNRVKEKLSFAWQLIIEDNVPIFCNYTPSAFVLEDQNERLVWREKEFGTPRPVLPSTYGLVHAQAAGKEIDMQRVTSAIAENPENGEPIYIIKIP